MSGWGKAASVLLYTGAKFNSFFRVAEQGESHRWKCFGANSGLSLRSCRLHLFLCFIICYTGECRTNIHICHQGITVSWKNHSLGGVTGQPVFPWTDDNGCSTFIVTSSWGQLTIHQLYVQWSPRPQISPVSPLELFWLKCNKLKRNGWKYGRKLSARGTKSKNNSQQAVSGNYLIVMLCWQSHNLLLSRKMEALVSRTQMIAS